MKEATAREYWKQYYNAHREKRQEANREYRAKKKAELEALRMENQVLRKRLGDLGEEVPNGIEV